LEAEIEEHVEERYKWARLFCQHHFF